MLFQVGQPDLAAARGHDPQGPTPPYQAPADLPGQVAAAVAAGLLSLVAGPEGDDPALYLDRGIARELHDILTAAGRAAEIAAAHQRAARYWQWHADSWPQGRQADMHDLLEARQHLLDAGEPGPAGSLTGTICAQLRAWGNLDQEAELVQATLDMLPAPSVARARWLHELGVIAQLQGDLATAEGWYLQAVCAFTDAGHTAGAARDYESLGVLAQAQGDYRKAERRYREAAAADGNALTPDAGEPAAGSESAAPTQARPGPADSRQGEPGRLAPGHAAAGHAKPGQGAPGHAKPGQAAPGPLAAAGPAASGRAAQERAEPGRPGPAQAVPQRSRPERARPGPPWPVAGVADDSSLAPARERPGTGRGHGSGPARRAGRRDGRADRAAPVLRAASASVPDRPADRPAPMVRALSARVPDQLEHRPARAGRAAPRGQRGPRRVRRPVRLALGALALLAVAGTAAAVARAAAGSVIGDPTAGAPRAQAAAWVAEQVSGSAVLACDPAMCAALRARGIPAGDLLVLGPGAGSDPLGSDIVVATAAIRLAFGARLPRVYAPLVIASFGTGSARIEIRVTAPDGAAAYRRALAADQLARRTAGAQLAGNGRLSVSAAARHALTAGQVDSRLLTTIAALAQLRPLHLIAFGDGGQHAPLRSAELTVAPGGRSALAPLLSFLHAQRSPYLANGISVTQRGTGQSVLRLTFGAPSPLGLLTPAGSALNAGIHH